MFYTKPVNKWETWKFQFIKKDLQKDEKITNSKSKETRIREYIFKILNFVNGKYDFMPNFDLDNPPLSFP